MPAATQPLLRAALEPLVAAATLAPSSHNTQPWRFRLRPTHVELHADRTRALPVTDPDDRELLISCGAALFGLRVAAAHAGLHAEVREVHAAGDPDHLADLLVAPGRRPDRLRQDEGGLYQQLARRRTVRRRFDRRPVPEMVLESLRRAAAREGAWLEPIVGADARRELAALVSLGDSIQWDDARWRRELAQWMHPRRRGDGLVVPELALPIAQAVVRTFDMGDGVGAQDQQLAEGSPVLAVLGTAGDATADRLRAGQALHRVLLLACAHGLQASYLNQPVQVPALRERLRGLLQETSMPQLVLRLGFPTGGVPPTPRRPVAEVIDD